MCKACSILITKSNKGYYKLGKDSHENVREIYKDDSQLKDDKNPPENTFARVEISPVNNNYLNPKKSNWQFKLDESIKPKWWSAKNEETAWECWANWKKELYSLINFKEARHVIDPIKIKHSDKVSERELELLKEWASIRASVGASIRASVGASVGDSVGDSVWASVRASVWASVGASVWASVWAYYGSLFILQNWKYTEKLKIKGYPFHPATDLWKRGLVASYDGKIWRIHNMGKKTKIIWEGEIKDIK